MSPSVGRIVHYQRQNLAFTTGVDKVIPVAAIITQVHEDSKVSLTLFPSAGGIEYLVNVPLGEEGEQDTWIWPPRV